MYVVLIQNDNYVDPEICLDYHGDAAVYKTQQAAQEFIEYIVEKGYPVEDYSIAELKKVEE